MMSPVCDGEVIAAGAGTGIPFVPGCMTPSEISAAMKAGASADMNADVSAGVRPHSSATAANDASEIPARSAESNLSSPGKIFGITTRG